MSAAPISDLTAWRDVLEAADLTPSTVRNYVEAVLMCALHAGKADPLDLTPDDAAEWLRRPGLSRNTRNAYYRRLLRFQVWCQATGRPAGLLDGLQKPRAQRTLPRPVTTPQLEALLAACRTPQDTAQILLGAYAGLRIHEAGKFRGEHLDRWDNTLAVLGKGRKHAVLPANQAILEHARLMPAEGWWFPSGTRPGQGSSGPALNHRMHRIAHEAGHPDLRHHQLRHWFGSSLVRSGVPLTTVRALMRHESLSSTQIYIEVNRAEEAAGIALLPTLRAAS